ncbi:hypothetical protein E2C01_034004 [Portunus trituberculatus]|uniref:Uncharacterized protein n=1 Tax=Portunus trituberculatus TaxID=210409 RepID=A0A5B7F4G8_PORTR|nr:hypothetical protein [Portunus trituberculatus]
MYLGLPFTVDGSVSSSVKAHATAKMAHLDLVRKHVKARRPGPEAARPPKHCVHQTPAHNRYPSSPSLHHHLLLLLFHQLVVVVVVMQLSMPVVATDLSVRVGTTSAKHYITAKYSTRVFLKGSTQQTCRRRNKLQEAPRLAAPATLTDGT